MKMFSNNNGFTLIEVMVALLILGFGVLAMSSMQLISMRGNSAANKVTRGTIIGTDGLEQVLSYGPDDFDKIEESVDFSKTDLVPQEYTADSLVQPSLFDQKNFDVVSTVTPNDPIEDMVTFRFTATSKVDGKQVTLLYMIADPRVL